MLPQPQRIATYFLVLILSPNLFASVACRVQLTQIFAEEAVYFTYRANLMIFPRVTNRILGRGYETEDLLNDTAVDLLKSGDFISESATVKNSALFRSYVSTAMRNRLHANLEKSPALRLQPGTVCSAVFDSTICRRTDYDVEPVWEDYSIVPPELKVSQQLWESVLRTVGNELRYCAENYPFELENLLHALGPEPYSFLAKEVETKWRELSAQGREQNRNLALSVARVVSRKLANEFLGYGSLKKQAYDQVQKRIRTARYPEYYEQAYVLGLSDDEIAESESISRQAVNNRNNYAELALLGMLRLVAQNRKTP